MKTETNARARHYPPEERFRILSRQHAEKIVTVPYDAEDVHGSIWMVRNNDDGSVEVIAAFTGEREAWSVLQQVILDAAEREKSIGW